MRADQAAYEELNEDLDIQPHVLKANGIWDMPSLHESFGKGRSAPSSTTGRSPGC